ncbi:MAG TPA: agmatine deiminase family protein [Polyangia bacterium]|nr:agmatine deiminase family protein [Polyangia bacterium]
MPAEWARHAATWIAWPHNESDWPGKFAPIRWVYGEFVRLLAPHERVRILVSNDAVENEARATLELVGAAANWDFVRVPTNRSWTRDTGPLFVMRDGKKRATHWRFNAWAKYDDWQLDVGVAPAIAQAAGVEVARVEAHGTHVVLEGGAVDVDGEGTLLATEECLQDKVQERNPELSTAQLEGVLKEQLGAERVVWLGRGIAGDDTHGHIDDLARFVAPGVVVLCSEPNAADENHRALAENRERLQGARDAKGRKLEVVALPMPRALGFEGRRLPASYANFYIANEVVLVPTFNDPADRVALGILGELFRGREVVGVHCVDLVWGLGTLHCMTQQEPA